MENTVFMGICFIIGMICYGINALMLRAAHKREKYYQKQVADLLDEYTKEIAWYERSYSDMMLSVNFYKKLETNWSDSYSKLVARSNTRTDCLIKIRDECKDDFARELAKNILED